MSILDALRKIVDRRTVIGEPGQCWHWEKATKTRPKATVHREGVQVTHTAARILVADNHGLPLADRWVARHTCDNHLCVNPEHVVPGSHRDNTLDMMKRARHGKAVLTSDSVRSIRDGRDRGMTLAALAAEYGVTKAAIWSVVHRRTWSWVS